MTVAGAVAGAALGSGAGKRPRLAAPGAVLLTAGLVLAWWGMGIFRGETGGPTIPRRWYSPGSIGKDSTSSIVPTNPRGGAGGQRLT